MDCEYRERTVQQEIGADGSISRSADRRIAAPAMYLEIPPPGNWQDFERLTLDLCKKVWADDYAQRNGRAGQPQASIDVYGYNRGAQESTGVQCKKRSGIQGQIDIPSHTLTTADIDTEIAAASTFSPKLQRFVLATTALRDAPLQEYARKWNAAHAQTSFSLALWFWEDYVEWLNKEPTLLYIYYSDLVTASKTYSPIEHYLRLLAMAFDRPALRTTLSLENRATDLVRALADTQSAVSTGRLADRDGRIIAQVARPAERLLELEQISRLLQSTREVVTNAISAGRIIEHPTCIEILDKELEARLNSLRKQALDKLNALLVKHNINLVVWHSY